MKTNLKRLAVVASLAVATTAASLALYPWFASAKAGSHKRTTAAQRAWIHRTDPLVEKGVQAMKRRDYSAAESAFEAAVATEPENHALSIHLARLYDEQGRDKEALEAYRRVVEPYESGASSHQTDPRVLARYGDLLAKFGEKSKAAAVYKSAVSASPTPVAPSDSTDFARLCAEAHTTAGERSLYERNFKDAERELTLAARAAPAYWRSRYNLAVAKAQLGDRVGAAEALNAAEKTAPAEELVNVRRERSALGLNRGVTVSLIEIKGKTGTVKEVPIESLRKTKAQ